MKANILAGGLGTRLRPITYEIPKPLIPVKKKPILNHLIDFFHRSKVSEIGILASRDHEEDFKRWRELWKNEMPDEKITLFFEDTPRGTFGGMPIVRDWLGQETFFLSNGDELKDLDLEAFQNFHRSHDGIGSIALIEVPDPHEYGVPVMEEEKIKNFLEKPAHPPSNMISSGLYCLDPEIFNHADFSKDFLMIEKDIFPKVATEGKLYGFRVKNGRWYDCGTLERWEKAIKEW